MELQEGCITWMGVDEWSCRKGVSRGWVGMSGAAGRVYHVDGWG